MQKKIVIISDGIGDTAREIVDCTMAQFDNREVQITRYGKIKTPTQLDNILEEVKRNSALLIYTIVSKELRDYLKQYLSTGRVDYIDLLAPVLDKFTDYLEQFPKLEAGRYRAMDEQYFKRVAAMEFVLANDDGKGIDNINEADIILVGISRTSKTPLSVYLSLHGFKAINIPLIPGVEIPPELRSVDQKKIFALTIAPEQLVKIRKERLEHLGAEHFSGNYADYQNIIAEVEWAENIYRKNNQWPLFDVTNKAIEETAAEIIKIIAMRNKRFF